MNNVYHYSVFAAARGGGKQFAIVEGVDNPVEMQRIAAQTGQPLTGFILNTGAELVEARFFSPTKEKGASDSGALVIGEHLRQLGWAGDRLTVQMEGEGLEVFYRRHANGSIGNKETLWWSQQENTWESNMALDYDELLSALGLTKSDLPIWSKPRVVGGHKLNAVIPVAGIEGLDNLTPNMKRIADIQQKNGINGVVAMTVSKRGLPDFRFFSPAKGLSEDNAGSYTVASLCAYVAVERSTEAVRAKWLLDAVQGYAMNKPSKLFAEFYAVEGGAEDICIGGQVNVLEVKQCP